MAQQESSLEYMKRFSMCNCLSVNFPKTYTAHAVSIDVFNELCEPGAKIIQPYSDLWHPGWGPRTLKIPKRVDTFLYSPFAEAKGRNKSYVFNGYGETRHITHRAFQRFKGTDKIRRVPTPTMMQFRTKLRRMDRKIDEMWGPNVTKILVHYDRSRASGDVKKKHKRQEEITLSALPHWPSVRVKLSHYDAKDNRSSNWDGWEHYAPETRAKLLEDIRRIERS